MRHGMKHRKLNKTSSHRKAMFRNMVNSLIEHEQIVTTLPKAKELRAIADKIITLGKRGDLPARRRATAKMRKDEQVRKLFDVLGPRYADRQGVTPAFLKLATVVVIMHLWLLSSLLTAMCLLKALATKPV